MEDEEEDMGVPIKTLIRAKDVENENDTELWLIRAPNDFDASILAAMSLKLDEDGNEDPGSTLQTIEGEDAEYEIQMGDVSESKAFRLLVHSKKEKALIVKSLSKQLIIAQRPKSSVKEKKAAEEEGPAAAVRVPSMVVPYSHVDQVPDLTVRFKPYGAGSGKVGPPPEVLDRPRGTTSTSSPAAGALISPKKEGDKKRKDTSSDLIHVKKEEEMVIDDMPPSSSKKKKKEKKRNSAS